MITEEITKNDPFPTTDTFTELERNTEFVRAICYHEAGHAVLGFYAGLSILRIEMDISKAGKSKSITVVENSGNKKSMGIFYLAGLVVLEKEFGREWLEKNNRKQIIFSGDTEKLQNNYNVDELRIETEQLFSLHRNEVVSLAETMLVILSTNNTAKFDWNVIRKSINAGKLENSTSITQKQTISP